MYIALHLLQYNRNPIIIITGFCIHNMTLQSRNHHHEVSCGVTLRYITLQIYIYYITLQYIHYFTLHYNRNHHQEKVSCGVEVKAELDMHFHFLL